MRFEMCFNFKLFDWFSGLGKPFESQGTVHFQLIRTATKPHVLRGHSFDIHFN
jgi:hypothetical protein